MDLQASYSGFVGMYYHCYNIDEWRRKNRILAWWASIIIAITWVNGAARSRFIIVMTWFNGAARIDSGLDGL